MSVSRVEIGDMAEEAGRIASFASALQTALDCSHSNAAAFAGAAYILEDVLHDFTKRLEELSK